MATNTQHKIKNAIPQSAEDITPSWVQQVLQRDLPGIIITDVDVKGSISQGEGYLSDIIAFDAMGTRDGSSQCYSLVAKLTDFERPFTVLTEFPKAFHIKVEAIEVNFYSCAIPELLSVSLQNKEGKFEPNDGPSDDPSFFPKCYFAATDPTSMVSVRVMENLKAQGFFIKPNRQLLSRAEMMLTAGALAQLHGLSHRLELQSATPLSNKYDWFFTETYLLSADTLNLAIYQYHIGVEIFAATFPDKKNILSRLRKLDVQQVLTEASKESKRFKVLNHADCWVNNIMIKYEGEVPIAVKLVDWQSITYMPPTCDLASLFLRCADWDVFHNHRDAILADYHQELQKTLGPNESTTLQSYTLEQLKEDFKADCVYGVFRRVILLSTVPADVDMLKMLQEIMEWGVI